VASRVRAKFSQSVAQGPQLGARLVGEIIVIVVKRASGQVEDGQPSWSKRRSSSAAAHTGSGETGLAEG
jgi:hypothetical protein